MIALISTYIRSDTMRTLVVVLVLMLKAATAWSAPRTEYYTTLCPQALMRFP
ncbi:hypothetical protein ACWGCC_27125 [Streptomyces nigrescens]